MKHGDLGSVGRVNSVWPLDFDGSNLDAAINDVEAHYHAQGLLPQFKLASGVAQPDDLAEHLVRRGYHIKNDTLVMCCANSLLPLEHDVEISCRVTDHFINVVTETSSNPIDGYERSEILGRVPDPSAFGMIEIDGNIVAVGLATFTGKSAGIACMRTRPQFRQKGYARSILRATASAARASGAKTLWLQVEADNLSAVKLYCSEGFDTSYNYQTWQRAT